MSNNDLEDVKESVDVQEVKDTNNQTIGYCSNKIVTLVLEGLTGVTDGQQILPLNSPFLPPANIQIAGIATSTMCRLGIRTTGTLILKQLAGTSYDASQNVWGVVVYHIN